MTERAKPDQSELPYLAGHAEGLVQVAESHAHHAARRVVSLLASGGPAVIGEQRFAALIELARRSEETSRTSARLFTRWADVAERIRDLQPGHDEVGVREDLAAITEAAQGLTQEADAIVSALLADRETGTTGGGAR